MAIGAPGPGGVPGSHGQVVPTRDLLADKRYQPTLRENLMLGVGKAHRQVIFSHYEYRNYERGAQIGTHGRGVTRR